MTEKKTVQAWIALGSNIDPQKNIEKALDRLSQLVTLQALSDFYRSAPFNRPEQADFINGVARIETDCPNQAIYNLTGNRYVKPYKILPGFQQPWRL